MKKLLRFTVNSTIAVLKIKLERNIHLDLPLWELLYSYHSSSVTHSCGGSPGGGLLPFISHIARGTCRPKGVWFWRRFGLKADVDFAHFGLESGIIYKGIYGRVWMCSSFQL